MTDLVPLIQRFGYLATFGVSVFEGETALILSGLSAHRGYLRKTGEWNFIEVIVRGPTLLALVATIGQMGLLGALIVFAPRPLYFVHLASTAPWGLSPLVDQQLAGLLMWVPAMLPYLGVGLWMAWSSLRPLASTR